MNTKHTSEPKTLQQAILYFADPQRALEYMIPLVWPHGTTCPHCGVISEHAFISTRRIWRCSDCRKQFSIKIGTVMEDSPLGLDKWLGAFWLIANAKNGISSYEIHRALSVTQKTAWFLLHRIRHTLSTGSFKKVSGIAEADETYIGGKPKNRHSNKRKERLIGIKGKTVVSGVLERKHEENPSQMQAKVIPDTSIENVQALVRKVVPVGGTVMTDTAVGFRNLGKTYDHHQVNHEIEFVKGIAHVNGTENFWSLLKRTIKGTYVAVSPEHLQRYLDEQCFRFNHRIGNDRERMMLAVGQMGGKRLTYKTLIRKDSPNSDS